MNRFLTAISDFSDTFSRAFSFSPLMVSAPSGVAENLMQRADACASRNPLEAQELRGAASAFLRVVR